jgi:hypothetical protein
VRAGICSAEQYRAKVRRHFPGSAWPPHEAGVEIAELIKRQPNASLSLFKLQPFCHKWMGELHVEGLRKAGLREE